MGVPAIQVEIADDHRVRAPGSHRRGRLDVVQLDGADIAPTVTWGINPGQAIGVDEAMTSEKANGLSFWLRA